VPTADLVSRLPMASYVKVLTGERYRCVRGGDALRHAAERVAGERRGLARSSIITVISIPRSRVGRR
jgi:hypothetical protein